MNDKQPSRLRRWLKRGAFTFAVLITLLGAVVVFENWRGHRAWRTYVAEQEAKGEVFDWRKLVPAPVPDDQNFAKTPLLAKLMDYKYDPQSSQAVFADPGGKAHLDGLFAWSELIKVESSWRKGTAPDWPKMQEWLRAATNSELPAVKALLGRPAGKPADDVLFLLAQNKAELDEIANAARRPHADFRVHYDEGLMALLPQMAVLKNFSYGFRLRAQAELAAGRAEAALHDWQTGLALNESLKADPILIALLVRIAMIESSLQVVWEGLAARRWSDDQLQIIESRLASINIVAEALDTMRGERAFNLMALDQMHRPEAAGFAKGVTSEHSQLKWMPSGWVSQTKLNVARMYERFVFGAFDPDKRQVDIQLIQHYEREVESALGKTGPYTMMARMLFPAIGKSGLKVASAQTAIHLARVACALERHRLADGKYPADLSALAPRFLPMLPMDLDRQPLRYELGPDGRFNLYSIGSDLVDDHGRVGAPNGKFTTNEGDWVWKYPDLPAAFE